MPSSIMVSCSYPPHLLFSWVLPQTPQRGLDACASLVVGSGELFVGLTDRDQVLVDALLPPSPGFPCAQGFFLLS